MEENTQVYDDQKLVNVNEEPIVEAIGGLEQNNDDLISAAPQTSIAGFWRRLFAFIIDVALIAVPLTILGFAFRDISFSLGPWGRIIGYALIIPYWGYCNSEKRSGQTLGKQVTKIAVVDNANQYFSLRKSCLRAFILGLILMLNGWALPFLQNLIIVLLVMIIVLGGTLALIYGLVFNRTTRQGIHDLLVGSYVINAPSNLEAVTPGTLRIHQRITYGLLGVGLLLGIVGLLVQRSQPPLGILEAGEWEEIQELQSSLMDEGEFFSVRVYRADRISVGSSTIFKDLNIEVWAKTSCGHNLRYCDEMIEQIAQTVFEKYDHMENISEMRIVVANRFDLGLAASWHIIQGVRWTVED